MQQSHILYIQISIIHKALCSESREHRILGVINGLSSISFNTAVADPAMKYGHIHCLVIC